MNQFSPAPLPRFFSRGGTGGAHPAESSGRLGGDGGVQHLAPDHGAKAGSLGRHDAAIHHRRIETRSYERDHVAAIAQAVQVAFRHGGTQMHDACESDGGGHG